MSSWAKAIVAAIGAGIMVLASSITDDIVTNPEKVQIAVAAVTSISVWLTANLGVPYWNASKTIVAGLLAGLNAVAGYLANADTLTNAMWLNVLISVGVAVGVWVFPNSPSTAKQ